MGVIVDTNVFIDAENGRLDLAGVPLLNMGSRSVYISAITVSELLAGIKLAKTADEHIRRHTYAEKILVHIPVIEFDTEVARVYAELYAHALGTSGRRKINAHDLQIAATALTFDHTVLTSNVDDFLDVPGLQVISPYEGHTIHESPADYGMKQ